MCFGYDDVSNQEKYATSGPRPGAIALMQYVNANWAGTSNMGIYADRPNTADKTKWSIHAMGRALDIGCNAGTQKKIGDEIAAFLKDHQCDLGVQLIIWNRKSWSVSRSGWKDYSGPNPHTDHLHVELNKKAADSLTLASLQERYGDVKTGDSRIGFGVPDSLGALWGDFTTGAGIVTGGISSGFDQVSQTLSAITSVLGYVTSRDFAKRVGLILIGFLIVGFGMLNLWPALRNASPV